MSQSPRSFADNILFSVLSAVSNLFALGLMLAASHTLATADIGVLTTALSFASIGEPLMDFGLHSASIRHIARDRGQAGPVLAALLPLKALSGGAMMAALIGIAWIFYPAEAWPSTLMIISAGARSYLLSIRGVLLGLEQFRHEAAVMFIDRVLMLVGGLLALWLGGGVIGLAASFVVSRGIALAFALLLARTHVGRIQWSVDLAFWRGLRDHAIPLGAFSMVLSVYNYIDVLLLSRLSTDWDAGVYGNAYRLYEGSTYATAILGAVLTPRLAALWAHDRPAHRRLAVSGAFAAAALGVLVAAGLWVLGHWALALFGADYTEGTRALRILALGLPCVFAIWILHSIAISAFRARLLIRTALISLAVNVGANLALIPHWHRDGAAAATVIGEVAALGLLVWGLRREFGYTPSGNPTIS